MQISYILKIKFLKYFFWGAWPLLYGCIQPPSTAREVVPELFDEGLLVLCEGVYGHGNSEVSYVNPLTKESLEGVFYAKNGFRLGDQAQYAAIYKGFMYVVVQNSAKIEVIDASDMKHIRTIRHDLIKSPRYIVFSGMYGYVSDWYSDRVIKIDLEAGEVIASVEVGADPDQMVVVGQSIWVANSGYSSTQSSSHTLSVLSLSDLALLYTLNVGERPSEMVYNGKDHVHVLCKGYVPIGTAEESVPGGIYTLHTSGKVVGIHMLEKSSHALVQPSGLTWDASADALYYLFDGYIWQYFPATKVYKAAIQASCYGLGYDVRWGTLVACKAPTFTSKGRVVRYSLSSGGAWVPLDSFQVGINPNGLIYNRP